MNKSCNLTAENVRLIRMAMELPVFVIGLVLNGIALVVFCCKGRWTETQIYMTNLVISDFALLLSLPFKMYSYTHQWTFGNDLCALLVTVYYANMYVSILTIAAISFDRYITIKHPFRAKRMRSPLKAGVLCILIWITVGTLSASFYMESVHDHKNQSEFKCFQKDSEEPFSRAFLLVLEIFGFVVPLITVAYCSAQSICTLQKEQHVSSQEEKTRSVRIIASNGVVFFLCFTPFHVGLLLKFLIQTLSSQDYCNLLQKAHTFLHVADCIASTNCCLDAIGYYFVAKAFRTNIVSPVQKNAQRIIRQNTHPCQLSAV
ncbi:UNVERIFIED_CONTAM: hypothetical protein FKN15_058146 [Acipenser sinensis]